MDWWSALPAEDTRPTGCWLGHPHSPLALGILNDIAGWCFGFFFKTNVLCSPGHKMFWLGMGMEWLQTEKLYSGPCFVNCPKCFLKVDIVRKNKVCPRSLQSSDFSPPWISSIHPSSFAPGLVLTGRVSIFKAKHSPTCISLRKGLLDMNS